MPFAAFGLHGGLVRRVHELGFTGPTAIQQAAIPLVIEGRDVLASAMTGSGKTAAFVLPILHRLAARPRGTTRALVLAPTRELAVQIDAHRRELAVHTGVSGAAVFGGVGMAAQERDLRRGVDILVATPGRLLDHLRFPYARLAGVEIVVLDEADRMLDMGFLPDVRRILRQLPAARQTLLFSATLPAPIVSLSREMLRTPATVDLAPAPAPAAGITQSAYLVPSSLKAPLLMELVRRGEVRSAIAFTRTKQRANRLAEYLNSNGVAAGRIHGNRSQSQRLEALESFRAGRFPILVATDIAARGIDVTALSHVVNFDMPGTSEDYVHRVGRTGRAQATGTALLFVAPDEEAQLRSIERDTGERLQRVDLGGFQLAAAAQRQAAAPAAAALATKGGRGGRGPSGPGRRRQGRAAAGGPAGPARPASRSRSDRVRGRASKLTSTGGRASGASAARIGR